MPGGGTKAALWEDSTKKKKKNVSPTVSRCYLNPTGRSRIRDLRPPWRKRGSRSAAQTQRRWKKLKEFWWRPGAKGASSETRTVRARLCLRRIWGWEKTSAISPAGSRTLDCVVPVWGLHLPNSMGHASPLVCVRARAYVHVPMPQKDYIAATSMPVRIDRFCRKTLGRINNGEDDPVLERPRKV